MSELYDAFSEYFEVRLATTTRDVEESYRLRYQVYCLEKRFERPEEHPEGLERDAYDSRSAHGLIFQKRTGKAVASVRLVLADPTAPRAPFPIEEHCGRTFYPEFQFESARRPHLAEISRFAVIQEFRRRRGEAASPDGLTEEAAGPNEDERRAAPHLTVGLFRATLELSVDRGVTDWYAVMEPTLFRLLKRLGVSFRQIGDDLDYHGIRRPCFVGIGEMLGQMEVERPDIWAFMTADGSLWPRSRRAASR